MASSTEDLRRRLEVLLGAKQDAAVDESQRATTVRAQADALRRAFAPSLVDLPNGQVELRLAMPDRAAFERLLGAVAEVLAGRKELALTNGDTRQPVAVNGGGA